MKIAVDFDGTLEFGSVQEQVSELIEMGHDVHIVTTRWDETNKHRYPFYIKLTQSAKETLHKDLYDVAESLNIPYHFTNMEYKHKYLIENNYDVLIDDNTEEYRFLRETKVKFVPVNELGKFIYELRGE
jgi:hypothetical protein